MQAFTIEEKNSLRIIKDKIKDSDNDLLQNALKKGDLPDEHILRFLRSRSHNIQSAYDRLKKLQEQRVSIYPQEFAKTIPQLPQMRYGIEKGGIRLLKHRDPNGRFVITWSDLNWDTTKFSGDEYLNLLCLYGWECLRYPDAQEKGFVVIANTQGFNFSHAMQFSPRMLYKWANIILGASPVKPKALHFINVSPLFKTTFSIIKMLVPKKISKRMHIYGKPEKGFLDEFIPSKHLPEWLGGDLTENEATDLEFVEELLSDERNVYYQQFARPSVNALKKS